MRQLARGQTMVLATHNTGKLREFTELLQPYGVKVVSAGELGLPEPEETETSFLGNARLKAMAAATASGMPSLADDSGFSVAALGGDPGIYSARWAGPSKDFAAAMAVVNGKIGDNPDRRAWFTCALCLAWPDGQTQSYVARVFGDVVWPPRGPEGFGYDPVFQPRGSTLTYGEMSSTEKHASSHRALAVAQFLKGCIAA